MLVANTFRCSCTVLEKCKKNEEHYDLGQVIRTRHLSSPETGRVFETYGA